MIDEFFDRLVDRLCETADRVVKPRKILFDNCFLGWRCHLYFGTLRRNVADVFSRVKDEENMDKVMSEGSERLDDGLDRLGQMIRRQRLHLARLDIQGDTLRFCGALALTLLAALGVAAGRGAGMGVMAASLCMLWLAMAVEGDYAPVSRGIHQTYLAALLLRTGAIGLMLLHYFFRYVAQGVPTNVVLQAAMLMTTVIHAVLFLILVLFNGRQPLLLRVLAGITGLVPAMTAAAAIALAAAWLFQPLPVAAAGILGALGATLAFLGEELIIIHNLGGIRLKYHSIWVCLLTVGGFLMMLLGVWLGGP